MRVFLSYPTRFDKGEGRFFRDVLTRMGHDVVVIDIASSVGGSMWTGSASLGYPAEVTMAQLTARWGSPDLYLYVEPDGIVPREIDKANCPTACVICDAHRNLPPRQELARFFDYVFLYQRNYRGGFSGHPDGHVLWLPYGCDERFFRPGSGQRDVDVAFVGQPGPADSPRARAIAAIGRRYRMNQQRMYTQAEMADVYGRAKIVVNLPIADDLNFRFFEALSCGAMLLTRREKNGQDELFRDGVHFVSFADDAEMLAKIDYFLSHETERKRIAEAGHSACVQGHTLRHRLETILAVVAAGAGGAPIRGLSPRAVEREWVRFAARWARVDALARLAQERSAFRAVRLRGLFVATLRAWVSALGMFR